jgi:hypothetical protein
MRWLFHNIYGDADGLIATAPDDVTCVPFGWDAETEQARNMLLAQLGVSVPALPWLVSDDGKEVPVASLPQPWTWEAVDGWQVVDGTITPPEPDELDGEPGDDI